ncbi:hypothetical protein Tco_0852317 [Tanacetum coccineum]
MQSLCGLLSRVICGNVLNLRRCRKNVLKKQFEKISVSDTEGLDKAYDRFQKLISLLEVHDGIDDFDIDDLYNNLKSHNVAFLSTEDTSSSNEVNTANGVSTASVHNSQGPASSSSYTDDLMVEEQRQDRANVMQLLKWKLHENCGVHTLFMMLEAEEESTMAFELIKFIKSMLEE